MKQKKILEAIENTSTFADVYDLSLNLYQSKNYVFEHITSGKNYKCRVLKEKQIINGKDVKYKREQVLEVQGSTIVEAFKAAVLNIFQK